MSQAALINNYGTPPVTFVRGAGAELWDEQGRRYLDFLCGLAVTGLGHAHPAVTAAVAGQAATLIHTSNLFANDLTAGVVATLDRLIRSGPGGDGEAGRVLFQNSGAEAVEAAIKLARKHQGYGRHDVITAYGSFHGRTLAALAATGQPEKHEPFQPLPQGFRYVPNNDIEALEAALDPSVAAVMLEPIQGEGGVIPATIEYLQAVRRVCDERGVLLIADEIQTGLGRTGSWFCFQQSGVQPDIVTVAKGLGNGFPVGAVWARADTAAAFLPGDHGSTFAGQPLALAAASAVLGELEAIDAPAVARRLGAELQRRLDAIDGVAGVRGSGLLIGVELSQPNGARDARDIASACLRSGLVVNGVTPTALRLAPPFVLSDEQLSEGCDILAAVLKEG
ncbi:MAG: acetylornithine transaminase [Acidimicrobiaceae bacterium]|nr:acetylornithine transaminase [Acidimicrobiaceae bacterium]MCY4279262.1 acetylornithine transaminase [Acidimicrobiaceae bacterium]MCY4294668.1 acetylornithine transaminase [Acidimicrobiaceae bacterium]